MASAGQPDFDPATLPSAEAKSDYLMSLSRERDDDEVSTVFVQQQIDELQARLEQAGTAGAAGVGLNQANQQLKDELQFLRNSLRQPTFFDDMKKTFEEPLKREVITRVYPQLQRRFEFNNTHGVDSTTFDTHLQECLLDMLSARQFYTQLGFLAFFKRNLFRLFAGVACTYFEAAFAFTIASSIINNALFTVSAGYVPDMGTIIGALNNAYQSCTQKNVILLLTSMGVSAENASQIFEKMKDLTMEQTKFVLKCLFLKRVVGGIRSAEHPNSARAAQGQHPTFFQLISDPSLFLTYLKSIGPPGIHGIVGEPTSSLRVRAITSFREFMDSLYPGIIAQLTTVFPDTADDQIKKLLFDLLLNLNDDSTEDETLIKLALLQSELYRCVEEKYMKKNGMTPLNFHKLCKKVCPGLLGGLTQQTVERIYGVRTPVSSQDTTGAVASDSVPSLDVGSRESSASHVMSTLRKFPSLVAQHARDWFGGWFPERTTKPDKIIKKTSFRGDATHQFLKAGNAIKNKIDKKYHRNIDAVINAFKNTVAYDENGNLRVSEPTDYDKEVKLFAENIQVLKIMVTRYEDTKKNIRMLLRKFQKAAYQQVDDDYRRLSSISVPFGGNSLATLNATETVIKRMTDALESMIVLSENAIDDIYADAGDGDDDDDAHAGHGDGHDDAHAGDGDDDEGDDMGGRTNPLGQGSAAFSFEADVGHDESDDMGGRTNPLGQGSADLSIEGREGFDESGMAQGGFAQGGNLGGDPAEGSGMPQGGRSRSRKRSVSKRTRRKGVGKKQKSKKNKRQSRRKVRRASSRKSRK
jgi:hypothetical protein